MGAHMTPKQQREYRARRKAEGRPVPGGPKTPHDPAKVAAHQARPEVKRAAAARARRYVRDPVLRMRHEARWKTRRAIASGKLTRQPCEVCGEPKTQAHHEDYTKPLEVQWLCVSCHRARHAAAKEEA